MHFMHNTNTNPLTAYGRFGDLTFNNSDKDEMTFLFFCFLSLEDLQ